MFVSWLSPIFGGLTGIALSASPAPDTAAETPDPTPEAAAPEAEDAAPEPAEAPEAEEAPEPEPSAADEPDAPAPTVALNAEVGADSSGHAASVGSEAAAEEEAEDPYASHSGRVSTIGGPAVAEDGWGMDFHGYFMAPMRVGVGKRELQDPMTPTDVTDGQSKFAAHAPIVADDQYLGYQHTSHNKRSWAELYFSYGNEVVRGTVALQAWNFSDIGYTRPQAQMGVGQAFVSINPKFRRSPVKLRIKVGGHDNRYGMAGKYDQGAYETYIFGRTRYLGETVGVDIPYRNLTFTVEHGFGATPKDPNPFNASRFTMTAHHHVGVNWKKKLDVGFHHILAFANEEPRVPADPTMVDFALPQDERPNGNMQIMGPDVRFEGGRFGYWYAGYSFINLDNARVVGPSVEVLHSLGAGYYDLGLIGNWLEDNQTRYGIDGSTPSGAWDDGRSRGTGQIHSAIVQTNHSVHTMIEGEEGFWGEGWDVKFSLYAMVNKIRSDVDVMDEVRRLKYGADVIYEALPWFGVGAKFDRVQPNNKVPEHSFGVFSPRLVFRSNWVTHEAITLQYSRYFYNARQCPADNINLCLQAPGATGAPDGFGTPGSVETGAPVALPDLNVFAIMANIYW
jgi:hypothetical protein